MTRAEVNSNRAEREGLWGKYASTIRRPPLSENPPETGKWILGGRKKKSAFLKGRRWGGSRTFQKIIGEAANKGKRLICAKLRGARRGGTVRRLDTDLGETDNAWIIKKFAKIGLAEESTKG